MSPSVQKAARVTQIKSVPQTKKNTETKKNERARAHTNTKKQPLQRTFETLPNTTHPRPRLSFTAAAAVVIAVVVDDDVLVALRTCMW